MLDGVDEVGIGFETLVTRLREFIEQFSSVPLTISSRPDWPIPISGMRAVNITPPTAKEISEFKMRLRL